MSVLHAHVIFHSDTDSSHSTMKAALAMAVTDMDTVDKAEFTQTLELGDLKAMSNMKQNNTSISSSSSSS